MQSLLDEVFEEHHPILGAGAVLMPENLEKGNVSLKVLAYNGGRIASMIHKPSGYEWMEEGFKNGGYEEFSGTEFRSSGWNETYTVVKYVSSSTCLTNCFTWHLVALYLVCSSSLKLSVPEESESCI
jgi:hypothetical protein